MAFYDFMEREDVYGILKDTLEYYFDSSVTIGSTVPQTNGKEVYLCFPRINAIIPRDFTYDLKEYVKRDNRITYSFIRKSIMSVYLYGVFNFPKKFMDKTLILDNPPKNSNDLLIYPGNKKIKIINFTNETIDNVLKNSFNGKWFSKELEIRENPKWDFVLPVTKIKKGVYREQLIIGYAYPRLDQEIQLFFLPKIKSYITQMQSSYKEEKLGIYKKDLLDTLQNSFEIIGHKITQDQLKSILKFANKLLNLIRFDNELIRLTFSHGDLQKGNVFLQNDSNKLWILDWETWGIRSEYYDRMIFYYNMRNSNQLVENISIMIKEQGEKLSLTSDKIPYLRDFIAIFIVEDIIWQADETMVLPNGAISNGLKNYMSITKQQELFELLEQTVKEKNL